MAQIRRAIEVDAAEAADVQGTDEPTAFDGYPCPVCRRGRLHIDTMLTDLEAVFRALKSELGLRPIFHQKTDRVSAHLFISVLAYHLVHTLRFRLKACNIHLSWEGIRRTLEGQDRLTVQLSATMGKAFTFAKRPVPNRASNSSTMHWAFLIGLIERRKR